MAQSLRKSILVIGGVALDITARVNAAGPLTSLLHTSHPGRLSETLGGVGRNVCEAAMRSGAPAFLVSAVGDDLAGTTIRQGMSALGMSTKFIQTLPGQSSAVYNAIHASDGQLIAAVAAMDIFDRIQASLVIKVVEDERPSLVCFDGNITKRVMSELQNVCRKLNIPVFFEPTSVPKSLKIFDQKNMETNAIRFVSPNEFEVEAMAKRVQPMLRQNTDRLDKVTLLNMEKAPPVARRVLPHASCLSRVIPNVITKLGEHGCLYTGRSDNHDRDVVVQYLPPENIDPAAIESVTGAGDSFVGTLLANLRQNPFVQPRHTDTWREMIKLSQQAACLTLKCHLAVSPEIKPLPSV